MKKQTLVVATSNLHKLTEIRSVLKNYEVIAAATVGFCRDIAETGTTFLENALIKARTVCQATGLPALADDSGLCVDALDGAPGIYSARYSGGDDAANRALLLEKMQGAANRRANFTCALALVYPDGREITALGQTWGQILETEQGNNGFGYDSLFWSDDLQKSFAMATAAEKNAVSHRGRALANLVRQISTVQ